MAEVVELRYADGPSTEVTVLVAAPPDRVWDLVCDIALPARFSSEFLGGRWLGDDTAPRLGARFAGRNRHDAIGEWETESTIVELEESRGLSYAVGDPDNPSTQWWYSLAPEESGTRLSMRMRMGPAPSGISRAIAAMPDKESRILRRRLEELRANMEATVAGIKGLAEA